MDTQNTFEGTLFNAKFIYATMFLKKTIVVKHFIYETAIDEFSMILKNYYIVNDIDVSQAQDPEMISSFIVDCQVLEDEKPTCLIYKHYTEEIVAKLNEKSNIFFLLVNSNENIENQKYHNCFIFDHKKNEMVHSESNEIVKFDEDIINWINLNILNNINSEKTSLMENNFREIHHGMDRIFSLYSDFGVEEILKSISNYTKVQQKIIFMAAVNYYSLNLKIPNFNNLINETSEQAIKSNNIDKIATIEVQNEIQEDPKENELFKDESMEEIDLKNMKGDIDKSPFYSEFQRIQGNESFILIFNDYIGNKEIPADMSDKITSPIEMYYYLRKYSWKEKIEEKELISLLIRHIEEKIKETSVTASDFYCLLEKCHQEIIHIFKELCDNDFRDIRNIDASAILNSKKIQIYLQKEDPMKLLIETQNNPSNLKESMSDVPNFLKSLENENNSGLKLNVEDNIFKTNSKTDSTLKKSEELEIKNKYNWYLEKLSENLGRYTGDPSNYLFDLTKKCKNIWFSK